MHLRAVQGLEILEVVPQICLHPLVKYSRQAHIWLSGPWLVQSIIPLSCVLSFSHVPAVLNQTSSLQIF